MTQAGIHYDDIKNPRRNPTALLLSAFLFQIRTLPIASFAKMGKSEERGEKENQVRQKEDRKRIGKRTEGL